MKIIRKPEYNIVGLKGSDLDALDAMCALWRDKTRAYYSCQYQAKDVHNADPYWDFSERLSAELERIRRGELRNTRTVREDNSYEPWNER